MIVRNPTYSNADGTAIDVELDHPEYGWIPFTASPNDCEQFGRDLYASLIAGEYGDIAPYIEPEPAPPIVPQSVTRRQGRLALLQADKLDAVEQAIAVITDPMQKRMAEIEYDTDTWERSNEFLQTMWAQLGGTQQELDNLFILAASL